MRKRETINPNPGDVRYIRRDAQGRFTTDQVDQHRSLSADDRRKAQGPNPGGQGDRGDGRPKKG